MITFIIENKDNIKGIKSITNNFNIEKFNYEVIISSNIEEAILKSKNDFISIIKNYDYINIVLLEHIFNIVNSSKSNVIIFPMLVRVNDEEIFVECNFDNIKENVLSYIGRSYIFNKNKIKYTDDIPTMNSLIFKGKYEIRNDIDWFYYTDKYSKNELSRIYDTIKEVSRDNYEKVIGKTDVL